ncbi:MAG: hypothetical protein HFE25_08025, partial [Clostridia bacterium]|nr:hypothetical protein [Clostridia bacterium]
ALLDAIKGNKTQPTGASNYGPLATNADGTLSTGTYYKYWFADKSKIVADGATPDTSKGEISLPEALKKIDGSYTPVAPETAASLMKDAADYVEANAVTPNTVTNKGTYVVYVLAKIPNHKAKVYKYEFKLDVAGIKYQIELWQSKKDGTGTKTKIEKNASGAYEVDYDPEMKIEATALYEWQFTGATTTTPPAGWSPNAATSVPGETGATNTVTQAYVRMHYKGQSATIGTLGHDNAWGYGYPSTETGADQNALDNSGEKKVNGVATARKAGYDGAPSEAGKYRVTLVDWNAETSNFNLVADTGHNEYLDFEIKQKELKKPDAATAPTGKGTYDGTEQTYTVSAKADGSYTYKMSLFTAGRAVNGVFDDSSLVDDLTAGTADDTKKEYKVTTAGTYKVALRLPLDSSYDASGKPNGTKPRNYKWENETKDYIEVEVELKQK